MVSEHSDRLNLVLFHAGVGDQIDERGHLRRIEWGPQAADSNLGVQDEGQHYQLLEGLTPATGWTLVVDSASLLLPADFDDLTVTIEFTYGRHEENLRELHRGVSEGFAAQLPVSNTDRVSDETVGDRRSANGARALTRAQVQAARKRVRR